MHTSFPSPVMALKRLFPYLILAAIGLLYFGNLVLHPTQILYADHSDLLPLHLPSKVFLVQSWQEHGSMPLWCPYSFSGLPFVHDLQVSAFYPLHWPLYLMPPGWVGTALSWLIVVHVILAGWCMFAYARSQGLEEKPALVAAFGYMFAGKWLLHVVSVGHYNMIPLAWLPLLLLWLEGAIRQGSFLRATGAGVIFSFFILGAYPYVTLYAGLFIALWTLAPALEGAGFLGADGPRLGGGTGLAGLENRPTGEGPRSWRKTSQALGRWLGFGVWTAGVGVALGAAQLLPGLEAAPFATRNLGVAPSLQMFRDGVQSLLMLTGPALTGNSTWDYEGGLGIIWLVLAVLAPVLGRGRIRFQAGVALLLLIYVLGGALVLQWLPGFRLFRLPGRSLLLLPLPIALLAGMTTQYLFDRTGLTAEQIQRCRRVSVQVLVALGILQGGYAFARRLLGDPIHFHLYWVVLPIIGTAAFWLFGRVGRQDPDNAISPLAFARIASRPRAEWLWILLLLLDLWAVRGPIVFVRTYQEIFTPPRCIQELVQLNREKPGRIMDREPPRSNSTPLWSALPELLSLESIGGFNPTDMRRYKEYLQFITDKDAPLRPPMGDFTTPLMGSFDVKNKKLLDLLGVRYLLQPSGTPLDRDGKEQWQRVGGEDPAPETFDFTAGGFQRLPPYVVYENRTAFPRAFVVYQAEPLPEAAPQILQKLKTTDFRRTVLLEEMPTSPRNEEKEATPLAPGLPERKVAVTEYRPNRVVVDVEQGAPGYLVLTDIHFPGWTCAVDGRPAEIQRGNYLFRVVQLPADARQVIFTFEPASYRWGKIVSIAAMLAVVASMIALSGKRR